MSFKSFFSKLSLLFISIFLFAVSTSFTSWIVYLPVLFLVHYVDLKFSWLWGGIYGFLSYFFYAFWLVAFDLCFLEYVFSLGELMSCAIYDNCAFHRGFDFVADFVANMVPFRCDFALFRVDGC